jgi:predicted transcriptional regulator
MFEAVCLVREDGLSVRKVAEMKGISKSALSRYVIKNQHDANARLEKNYSHSKVFTTEQEEKLADYLLTCCSMFHGLTP